MENFDCLGCRIANKIEPVHVVYEDEHAICVMDIAPLNEGHTLILPKRHYRELDELEPAAMSAVFSASVAISRALKACFRPDGIRVMQNGGVFNDLDHYHMHVFPRYRGDGFGWIEPDHDGQAGSRLAETAEKLKSLQNHFGRP